MIPPPRQTSDGLEAERLIAIQQFRQVRLVEPAEQYHGLVDEYHDVFHELLERTVDLTELDRTMLEVLGDARLAQALRYLTGPPMSADDLSTVAEVDSLRPSRLRRDPAAIARILGVVRDGLDRRRFVWVAEGRDADEAERAAAVLASAALLATQRLQTARRTDAKNDQEEWVRDALIAAGLVQVETRRIDTLRRAPHADTFCRESDLAGRKADFVVGLRDGRILALECKVSNSATNSVKRLNNDAAVKAVHWLRHLGERQVIPAAVLSGVYKQHNLVAAQAGGLTLFWAHRLDVMTDWIRAVRATV